MLKLPIYVVQQDYLLINFNRLAQKFIEPDYLLNLFF